MTSTRSARDHDQQEAGRKSCTLTVATACKCIAALIGPFVWASLAQSSQARVMKNMPATPVIQGTKHQRRPPVQCRAHPTLDFNLSGFQCKNIRTWQLGKLCNAEIAAPSAGSCGPPRGHRSTGACAAESRSGEVVRPKPCSRLRLLLLLLLLLLCICAGVAPFAGLWRLRHP